jgi:signal transduction histidine kinase
VKRLREGAKNFFERTRAGTADRLVKEFELRQRTVSGEWRTMSVAATIDRELFFVVSRDVTSQREVAQELQETHRLEAVGQLAAGMAHEINTPIQYVGDNVKFASEAFESLQRYVAATDGVLTPAQRDALAEEREAGEVDYLADELPRALGDAREGVKRVAELVRALKEFAHPDQGDKASADVNKALERALVMARGELRHVGRVETNFGVLPPLRCHIGSLSQVFLNLLVNAAHAVEERTAKQGVPFAQHCIGVASRLENDEVVISISDTGCGIPDSIRERIFEPFFTTKPMGKGSGQGLPLVRNVIIGKHGGRIELTSAVNVGTTFTLRLPLHTKSEVQQAA